MKKKKKTRWVPLLLIALLLPVLIYTSRTAWGIIRQSGAEQAAFEALSARVTQNIGTGGAPTAPRAGQPRITAVLGGEVVTLEPETFNGADGTIAVTGASGARRIEALSSLADFQGSAEIETEKGRATVDFSSADVRTATVEIIDSEASRARVGLDRVLAMLAEAEAAETAPREILAQYQPLHDQNPDFFGWLKIEDTVIDYPVMFTPEDPEYYLHRSFDGKYSYSGTPFVEGHCSADGSYYIIYAHHMRNGTMFGTLPRYAEQAYWEAHPVIRFDTLYEQRAYQVVAAFKSKLYGEQEKGAFRYYEYTDLSDPKVFDEYVSQALAAALYDTGVEIAYGDELLALSTCNYHTKNGRFVVLAKHIDGGGVTD